jgi:small redox-active disulfide protein 2
MKETTMPTIKVLGPGCANCQRLTHLTEQALAELGRTIEVEKVTDYAAIAAYGVMSTPALVVDEQVVMAGRIPGLSSLKGTLAERLGAAV